MPDTAAAAATAEPSPARAALADAIATRREWESFRTKAQEALAAVEVKRAAAGRALLQAEDALRQVQTETNQPKAALARALGHSAGATLAQLERAVALARETYDEIAHEHTLVKDEVDRLQGPGGGVARAEGACRTALGALLVASPGVAGLLTELHAVRRRAKTITAALDEVARVSRALPAHRYAVHPADEQPDPQLAATWRDVIAKLLVDGNAPLPGGDPEPAPPRAAEAEAA
jgi:hypothetical protein